MKKAMQFIVMAALIVSVSGCANTNHPQTIQESLDAETLTSGIDESAEPEKAPNDSFSESKTSSADDTTKTTVKTESSQAETPPVNVSEPPQNDVVDIPKPELSKVVEPIPEQNPTPTSAEENPTPESVPSEPPQENILPAESIVPDFNIDYWIGYARSYAESIGLKLSPTAVDCWDNPMIAGAHSKYLERDITDCLNCYKNIEGFTGVWIWAEPDGNGAYKLYIGYE